RPCVPEERDPEVGQPRRPHCVAGMTSRHCDRGPVVTYRHPAVERGELNRHVPLNSALAGELRVRPRDPPRAPQVPRHSRHGRRAGPARETGFAMGPSLLPHFWIPFFWNAGPTGQFGGGVTAGTDALQRFSYAGDLLVSPQPLRVRGDLVLITAVLGNPTLDGS